MAKDESRVPVLLIQGGEDRDAVKIIPSWQDRDNLTSTILQTRAEQQKLNSRTRSQRKGGLGSHAPVLSCIKTFNLWPVKADTLL